MNNANFYPFKSCLAAFMLLLLSTTAVWSQEVVTIGPAKDQERLVPVRTSKTVETYKGKEAVKAIGKPNFSDDQFLKIDDLLFHNGIIELELAGLPSATASDQARGFIGVAFRIDASNEKLECIYLRPTNARAEDQVRRNHSVQYVSHPEYPWHRLRKESPEKYETYVDLVPGEWTKIRIEVQGEQAKLYVHGATQPVLIVNDLKHGADQQGAIGLWVGPGTEGYFSSVKVTKLP